MDKEARLEMIKAAAEKVARRNRLKGASCIGKLRLASRGEIKAKSEKEKKFDREIEKMNDNTHLYWNDASQYAEKHYGDTYAETTKFDNEWN